MSFLFGEPKSEIMCVYQEGAILFDINILFHFKLEFPSFKYIVVTPITVFRPMGAQSLFLI